MEQMEKRLLSCFQTVFPDLPPSEIPAASQTSVAAWDSVAAITLLNVVEEEFGVQMDFDRLAQLDSFSSLRDYLRQEMQPL